MAANEYHFITTWRLDATPEEVTAILGDAEGLARWWPSVYDWRILAEKGILRRLSFVMKPIFGANHRWAMARGEESLRLELERRRATTLDARMRIPQPPGPTFPHNLRRRSDRRG